MANLGLFEEAIVFYEKALKLNPTDYICWYDSGLALARLKRYEKAIFCYDRALAIKNDDKRIWYDRGLALMKLGQHKEAVASHDQVISLDHKHAQAWNSRGFSLEELTKYEEALDSYERAVELEPNHQFTWINRGFVLGKLGQRESAFVSFRRATDLDSKNLFPETYIAWNGRGMAAELLGRYEEAIFSYEQSITLRPEDLSAWFGRAKAICKLNLMNNLSQFDLIASIQNKLDDAYRDSDPHIAALNEALSIYTEESVQWARIHAEKGKIYLKHSKRRENPTSAWRDAIRNYKSAYTVLSAEDFPEDRLEILQGLTRAYLAFEDISTCRVFQREGQELFERIRATKAEALKPDFVRKFISFSQLEVDLLIGEQNPTSALEQAESYKNRCLTWMLDGWQTKPQSPSFFDIQSLLTPTTAIIYWHLGFETLTTFLITPNADEPIVFPFDRQKQARQFKTWLGNYDSEYYTYADKKPKAIKKLEDHPWRQSLISRLSRLQKILKTDNICEYLPEEIQHLILIPHRDLHRLPLHHFFPEQLTCTYLPSLKIGLQNRTDHPTQPITPLLNVDDPQLDQSEMRFAQIESAVIRHLTKEATPIQRSEASSENVFAELQKGYKTFHFTGHGAYNARKPSDSALGLADGSLTAKQINQLDLSSYQLVCLAACETALTGKEGIPDEYVGLASAFLKAGAANVLSTLWPVDEIASAWIMIRFYQNLLGQHTPTTALKHAQRWIQTVTHRELADWIMQLTKIEGLPSIMKERLEARAKNTLDSEGTMNPNQPTKYQHPYYWAAFTLIGQG